MFTIGFFFLVKPIQWGITAGNFFWDQKWTVNKTGIFFPFPLPFFFCFLWHIYGEGARRVKWAESSLLSTHRNGSSSVLASDWNAALTTLWETRARPSVSRPPPHILHPLLYRLPSRCYPALFCCSSSTLFIWQSEKKCICLLPLSAQKEIACFYEWDMFWVEMYSYMVSM